MINRILYIGFQYEYGKKENGPAINYKAWYENFIKLGYKVDAIFYEEYSKYLLQEEILRVANSTDPDLVFFILQKNQIDIDTLKKLKGENFFIVNYFGDDQWRFEKFSSIYANNFDACMTTDKFSIDKYKSIGQKNIIRSQWASLESNVEYINVNYKYDVSFVGGVNPYRKWFFKELGRRGIRVHCFGDRWENGRVSYKEMESVFSETKINLNVSNSVQYDIRYLISNPRNIINTLKSAKNKSQTKARIFEIPVHGGFELTEYVPSLEDYFIIGKELACYRDIDEAELLIKYYLSNEDERELIKVAGVKRARENHTFNNRIIEFMEKIEKIKSDNS